MNRIEKLMKALPEGADAALITSDVNRRYFTGLGSTAGTLLAFRDAAYFIIDFRYIEVAKATVTGAEVILQDKLYDQLGELLKKHGARTVALETDYITVGSLEQYRSRLPQVEFLTAAALNDKILEMRSLKDEEEIACIRRACSFADKAFEDIVHFIRPGRTEIEVAARLEQVMREAGSEKPSFDTIVASGLRGSMPHGTATEKVIEAGDFVTMDYGAKYQGYCSDITRTVCVGEATARQREVYGAVLGAQELVFSLIAPGKSGKEIDAASREFLKKYDLAQYFGHGLGHSLGLEIHEEPRLSPSSTCEHLVPGMLITDEPGVYLPGWGGLRIEDTVLVTETGSERLTKSSKQLVEIR